jgi:sulfiredoxin
VALKTGGGAGMLSPETSHDEARKIAIANIYVPIKRRATLKPEIVQQIAQSMLEVGQKAPIQVRRDGDRLVLAHGLHRLEARKALGEETIYGYLVQAEKH